MSKAVNKRAVLSGDCWRYEITSPISRNQDKNLGVFALLRETGGPRFSIGICQCLIAAGAARYIGQGIGRRIFDHNLVFDADSYVKPVGDVG